jgi:transcriptional regulator with XRE-family HTH domain
MTESIDHNVLYVKTLLSYYFGNNIVMRNIQDVVIENLKALRAYQKMSGNEFADKCRIHQRTYNRIERGESWPHLDILASIACRNELQVWQLLVPGFDPAKAPVLQDPSGAEKDLYDRINRLLDSPP